MTSANVEKKLILFGLGKEQRASRMARQTLVRSHELAKMQLHQPCSAHSSAEISEDLSWCITTL